jgi:hypothetical protein
MLGMQIIRRFGSRSLAFTAAAILLVPQFACQCADGSVKPFCLPSNCDSSIKLTQHSCCQQRQMGCCKVAHATPCGSAASSASCCRLIVDAQTPATTPVVVDHVLWLATDGVLLILPLDHPGLTFAQWRHARLDASPPPIDLVITQLRLTI